jgi:glycosyltransferase involved in cell wall biosynthesis
LQAWPTPHSLDCVTAAAFNSHGTREARLVSVVAPVFNEEATIAAFCDRVRATLEGLPFELLLVDDGSSDGTAAMLEQIASVDPQVKVLSLSRNFGHQAALTAGLDAASGNPVVMLDSDLQDPPELIPQMLDHWRAGSDVVFGVRVERVGESPFKLRSARAFYRLFARISGIRLEENAGDYRLLDRRALDAILSMRERHRFLRGMTVWVGFNQTRVPYKRAGRHGGETKYTLPKMVRLSLDALSSFSYVPLRLATWIGFLFALVAFLAIPVIIILRAFGEYLPGFATITIIALLLAGIQLIAIGVVGEYVGRIYEEIKRRPLYLVRERLNFPEPPQHDGPTQRGEETATRH